MISDAVRPAVRLFVVALIASGIWISIDARADERCGAGRHWSTTRRVCVRDARTTTRPVRRGRAGTSGAPAATAEAPSPSPTESASTSVPDACPAGQERSADSEQNCCWPNQVWVPDRGCAGRPRCPSGFDAYLDTCLAPCGPDEVRENDYCACAGGRSRWPETSDHCCWSGQVWAPGRATCVGQPAICPPLHVIDEEHETCRPALDEAARQLVCPEGMVGISRTTFVMGSAEHGPAHSVTVSPFCIARLEVTVDDYARCVGARACTPPATGANWGVRGREAYPVDDVDWSQARAYCAWRGGRLPSEAEWELAARGTDGRTYPWGNEGLGGVGRLHWSGSCGGRACARTSIPVGLTEQGVSPYGLLDAVGNVWEWTADRFGAYSGGAVTDPTGPTAGTDRVIRGGGWDETDPARVTTTVREGHNPADRHFAIGIRCAATPAR